MQSILEAWLVRTCASAKGCRRGTLWLGKAAGVEPDLAAIHPARSAPGVDHRAAAAAALAAGRAVVRAGDESDLVAAPGAIGGVPMAAVLERPKSSPREQAAALDSLDRALGWLAWTIALPPNAAGSAAPGRSERPASPGPGAERTLDLLAIALEPRPLAATGIALTSELASLLGCERVTLGRLEDDELVVAAVSHTPRIDPRSRLARGLVAAMHEAIDQDAVVVYPTPEGELPQATTAHRKLAEEQGLAEVWTVPLRDDDALTGALLVEFAPRQRAVAATRDWLAQLASLVAPVLGLRARDQASLRTRARRLLRDDLPEAMGLDRLNVRLGVGIATLLLLALALLPATHRVAAPAELEGIVQRAIVAPMDAYVAESRRRAGDAVRKGEVLGLLEDADLRLEARKWQAKREQRRKELRAAMATRDRSRVRILQAQVEQADAELELIHEQGRRTRLVAPFDGVVTRGDLSQALGSPVERGEVLFEVAPRDDHRIVLEVDGRDIAFVEAGQPGRLTLQSLPDAPRSFTVRRVTPISSSESGRSFFRVEAELRGDGDGLRPGMEGVGKIDVGRRSLLWIWTHSVLDWLRMAWWAWVP